MTINSVKFEQELLEKAYKRDKKGTASLVAARVVAKLFSKKLTTEQVFEAKRFLRQLNEQYSTYVEHMEYFIELDYSSLLKQEKLI